MQAAKKPKSRADCQDCTCTLETQWSQKLCRLQSGCTQLKSTVAYLLRNVSFDTFIRARGIVDVEMLADLNQTVVVPALLHQRNKRNISETLQTKFQSSCLIGDRGTAHKKEVVKGRRV